MYQLKFTEFWVEWKAHLFINLPLSVFKKLFQCYIQEGKHKAVVIGPRASTYSVFPQQSWKINRYKKPNSKSGAVFSSVCDSSCPWCPHILQCNSLIIYKCFGCNRYYAVGEVVVTSKEELAIAQQSLIEVYWYIILYIHLSSIMSC